MKPVLIQYGAVNYTEPRFKEQFGIAERFEIFSCYIILPVI